MKRVHNPPSRIGGASGTDFYTHIYWPISACIDNHIPSSNKVIAIRLDDRVQISRFLFGPSPITYTGIAKL